MFDGIEYTIDVDMEFGKRIVSLKYQNNDVKDSEMFLQWSLIITEHLAVEILMSIRI